SLLSYIAFGVLPLFGTIVTGAPAIVGVVVEAALCFGLAWSVYLLRPLAWWGTLVLMAVMAASMVLTFARVGVKGFYSNAGYTREQIEMMTRFGGVGSAASVVAIAVAALAM